MIKQKATVFKKFTCPTCNAECGLLVEVKNNKVISVKPDKKHPLSKGFCCPKGIALGSITNDIDRILRPLKRIGNDFKEISWKQALHEIADKLTYIRDNNSPNSIAYYMGTNSLHNYSHAMFVTAFMRAIGSTNMYNAGSVDNNNKFVAQNLLYGNSIIMPIPDLPNTDLLIIIGSNPAVTKLSLVTCPNVLKMMKEIKDRGGEIYIIDPWYNKTAKLFTDEEHYVPIYPDTDIFILMSMINIILTENLEDKKFLKNNTRGSDELKRLVKPFTPELAEKISKVPAEKIYDITRKFAKTEKALIYGRLGTCLSTFSTLNAWAIEVLNIISGKLDHLGGAIFGKNVFNIAKMGKFLGMGSFNQYKSRIRNYPEVMGAFPLGILAREIMAPKNPVKALIISGGNPLLSAPNSNEFKSALKNLEFCVVLDFYINETALFKANYVLPVRTPLENSNYPVFSLNYHVFPHVEYTKSAIMPKKYGPKAEWEILLSLTRLMKLNAFGNKILDMIPKLLQFINIEFNPDILIRIFLFLGQILEKRFPYLSKNALTLRSLKKKEFILLGPNEYGVLKKHIQTSDKKIHLLNPLIKEQIKLCKNDIESRLAKSAVVIPDNEFLMIGRRCIKTMNSWMHNTEFLWRKKEIPKLLINTYDAIRLKLHQNEVVTIENELGSIKVPIQITDDIMSGVVSYPHGWGHLNPKLSFANLHPGENINVLTNSHKLDKLSGMPLMNGYKVKLLKIPS